MGVCGSNLSKDEVIAVKTSRAVDKDIDKSAVKESLKTKLLLLGAGESGKSTIFKQMKVIYGVGYSDEELRGFTRLVYHNLMASALVMLEAMEAWGIEVSAGAQAAKAVVMQCKPMIDASDHTQLEVDEEMGSLLQTLWADENIQRVYERRAEYQLSDSTLYFFSKLDVIKRADYVPNVDDVLRVRVRTSGVTVENYRIDGAHFVVYDVGGQRNERRKWIHLFDNVTAVIFIVALSEYDQTMFEDSSCNRMVDSLDLFKGLADNPAFRDIPIILFLNKVDLFEQKIKRTPIGYSPPIGSPDTPRFEDCAVGTCTCGLGYPTEQECSCGVQEAGKHYIRKRFLSQPANPDKLIFPHITFATNSQNVKHVFDDCTQVILRSNLAGNGLA